MQTLHFENGDSMPQLGLGTWKSAPGEVYDAVREALRLGYRHIDCAHIYGNEDEIGQALQDTLRDETVAREELWITSKLWNNRHDPRQVLPALETTLRNLRLDYLDLYLIHWPVAVQEDKSFPERADDLIPLETLPLGKTWGGMEDCVDAGLARHIGVSNFSAHKLEQLLADADIRPAMNQIELHPYLQQSRLLGFCMDHEIPVTAYAPLGSSDRPERLKGEDEPVLLNDPVIGDLAQRHEASPAQILIAWALHRGTAVIPKSVHPQRLQQNLQAAQIELSEAEMAAIAALDRHRRYVSGNTWALPGSRYTLANIWDE